jgi:biopolymer transport protein ExbD
MEAVTHKINVTPFIDAILMLLVTFIVAAPLATLPDRAMKPAFQIRRDPRFRVASPSTKKPHRTR